VPQRRTRPVVAETDRLLQRMAGRFARVETRRRTRGFVLGLLADLLRKNCWTIAEHAGTGIRTACSTCSTGPAGTPMECVMTCATPSPPVSVTPRRCWWSTKPATSRKGSAPWACSVSTPAPPAGRIENAQVAFYLTYAGAAGHAMIDRELYLPTSWTADEQRCTEAGVPADIEFLTNPRWSRA
jgi:hypothetical protein